MTRKARSSHTTTDQLSEQPDEPKEQAAKTGEKTEDRTPHAATDTTARVRDGAPKTRERSGEVLQSFGDYPAIH